MKLKNLLNFSVFLISSIHLGAAMAIETPRYEVLSSEGSFEIRHYPPMLIAQVQVDGDMDEASNKGFRQIAGYIFGGNRPQQALALVSTQAAASSNKASSDQASIEKESKEAKESKEVKETKGIKIAMTAPVTVQPQGAESGLEATRLWRVNFVLPSQFTLKTIPRPSNPSVEVKELPEKYYAVQSYSGFNFQSKVEARMQETVSWAQSKGYEVLGQAQLSRYDPPWTLPMFRTNEIWVEIAKP